MLSPTAKLQLYFYSFNLITSYFQSFSYFCRRSIYCYKILSMEANNYTPSLDKYQIPVVEASQGYHLVLASPGCGKNTYPTQRG